MFDLNFFVNKCRFCWTEISSHDATKIDDNLSKQYEYITNNELISSPKLSNLLCSNCQTKINCYYDYKQELIEKQDKLLSFLSVEYQNSSQTDDEDSSTDFIELSQPKIEEFISRLDDQAIRCSRSQLTTWDAPSKPEEPSLDPIKLPENNPKDPETCQHCFKSFVDQRKLEIHIEKFHKRTQLKCEYCEFIGKSKSELLKHVKSNHLKSNSSSADIRICPDCGKILKGNNHLNFHIKTKHLKLTKFQCDLCGFRCYGKYELRSHILIHHLPLALRKEYKCDQCPSILTTAMSLKTHKQHKHSGLKPHTCIFCGKSYALKETLKSHIRNVHNGERKYKCSICGKGFNSNPRLTDHINNVHGHKQEIPCDKCGKIFNSARNLQTHSIYHTAPTLKCDYCDKMFYIRKNLREHQESVHLGVTYQCDVCQRNFQSTSGLRRHSKSHRKSSS